LRIYYSNPRLKKTAIFMTTAELSVFAYFQNQDEPNLWKINKNILLLFIVLCK